MSNAICILCNDEERFKIVTKSLPLETPDLFVINDTRLGDRAIALKAIYNDAIFIKGADIINEFSNHANISRFALVLKLLIPWYMFKHYDYEKVLILDDDVFITDKVNSLFDKYFNGKVANGLLAPHGYSETSFSSKVMKYTSDLFEVPYYESEKYFQVNAGHILFNRKDITDEYEHMVKKWCCSDFFTEILNKQTSWRSYFLDEVFMTFFCNHFMSMSKEVKLIIKKYEKTDYESIEKAFKTKALIHNCLQQHKSDMFKDLIDRGIVK